MKKQILILATMIITLELVPARAQVGLPGGSPLDDAMAKVFGTNLNFSADMETEMKMMPKNETIALSGKIYFAGGKSRTEMDLTSMKGSQMTPQVIAQMKTMGMDKMVTISQMDKKAVYMIYPGLTAYTKMEMPDAKSIDTNDFKVETAELGKETLDGHPCTKNKYTVNNTKTGMSLIMTSWNATDLKDSPIKIEQSSWSSADSFDGSATTMHFTNLKLSPTDASLFQPPTGYKAYDNIQTMMQAEVMKKMGGGMGMPPNH